jgi:hypothetical protein
VAGGVVTETEILELLTQVTKLVDQMRAVVPRLADAVIAMTTSANQQSASVAALTDAVSVLTHEVMRLRGGTGGQQ